ncbi:8-amino-7-oxononanoate synthase BioF2 [Mycobacterium tuberculosis UT0069]|nr:8-amino-7-oxononanoate synthase BioF2 [Mycobacterium tuberculosis 1010SM]KBK82563.1 8-amino-7-oxononanoate synthase BioF2 [Mycobacterium tuberculosis UT0056]KBL07626.1 8-amino-7-oxononanoate synthase BioF2 [Mycobacterium tuberculosis UT0069]
MPTGLGYDFLRPVEDSGINDLKHYYFMADLADGQPLGRANLYSVCFDLATTDRKLTPAWRTTIKRWFPGFMTFRFLECGLLTMVSNPLALRSDTDLERVLPVLAGQMDQLAHDDGSDFLMIRDVDPEHYQRYLDILRPLGFRPALGFSRVDTTISWSSVEEALGCLSHKRRLPLKTSLEFRERFGIEVEELDEYAEHAPVLARLWRNVKTEAKDYQREDLNPEFFAACSRHLHGRSRLWLFRYQGTPIAFFLNVWGADENYILLEWGIDRDFEHYRKANLYRAALMLSLKDAISRDKRRMEMGITNYFTKLRIPGARVIPTIYFLRHSTDPVHTATLARMMMHNIQRPTLPDDMSEEFCRWEERIRLDQDGLPEHDIFRKIDRQHKYTGLKLGGVYGFIPDSPDRSDPRSRPRSWARSCCWARTRIWAWPPIQRWWRPRRRPRDGTAPAARVRRC